MDESYSLGLFFKILGPKIWHVMDVLLMNFASVGFSVYLIMTKGGISFETWLTHVQGIGSITALSLTISYTVWKWRRDYANGKKPKKGKGTKP